jgi:hypothetical protein
VHQPLAILARHARDLFRGERLLVKGRRLARAVDLKVRNDAEGQRGRAGRLRRAVRRRVQLAHLNELENAVAHELEPGLRVGDRGFFRLELEQRIAAARHPAAARRGVGGRIFDGGHAALPYQPRRRRRALAEAAGGEHSAAGDRLADRRANLGDVLRAGRARHVGDDDLQKAHGCLFG